VMGLRRDPIWHGPSWGGWTVGAAAFVLASSREAENLRRIVGVRWGTASGELPLCRCRRADKAYLNVHLLKRLNGEVLVPLSDSIATAMAHVPKWAEPLRWKVTLVRYRTPEYRLLPINKQLIIRTIASQLLTSPLNKIYRVTMDQGGTPCLLLV